MYYLKREVYKNFIFSGEIMEGPVLSAPFPILIIASAQLNGSVPSVFNLIIFLNLIKLKEQKKPGDGKGERP